MSIWGKKVWQINTSANRLLIVSTNSDGFSLVNHGQCAKFAKPSCYTVFKDFKLQTFNCETNTVTKNYYKVELKAWVSRDTRTKTN